MSMQLSIFKTSFGCNKAKNRRLILAFFFTTELSSSMLLKKCYKNIQRWFFALFTSPEKLEKSIVAHSFCSGLKYVNTKSWSRFNVKLQGSK